MGWLLLAHHERRLPRILLEMWSMSMTRRLDPCARRRIALYHQPVAFPHMGNWHFGSIPYGDKALKFFIVTIEYFTKWIEVEPIVIVSASKIQNFVWQNIIYRFVVLRTLILDNGTQFASKQMKEMCENWR